MLVEILFSAVSKRCSPELKMNAMQNICRQSQPSTQSSKFEVEY